MPKSKIIFVTATDTGVGKTVTTLCLGHLMTLNGHRVGVMKPVQCAGHDAQMLKKSLRLRDDLKLINPYYAPEPLSPHLSFRRSRIKFDKQKVLDAAKILSTRYDILLVEGAGGLMVPITDAYFNADLIVDLKAQVIIVARLGLGTINHTLLTIREARRRKLKIIGLIFCETSPSKKGLPEKTNPYEIQKLSGVPVLGIIPYLKSFNLKNISRQCQKLNINF